MHHSKSFFRVLTIVSSLALTLLGSDLWAGAEKISPQLAKILERTENPVPVVVLMKQLPPIPHTLLGETRPSDREILIKRAILQQQSSMREYVNELAATNSVTGDPALTRTKFFWTTNAFMGTGSRDVITDIANRPEVTHILLDRKFVLSPEGQEEIEPQGAYTYGLEKIGVPEVRQAKPELTGKGVIVGIVDTGIDAKHPEFANKKITFHDFVGTKTEPYDDNGHGTHVAGTISGIGASGTQIGVAPDVTLVVAKVFSSGGGASLSGLLRGMEWVADPDGNASTNDKPRVVSNSWGGALDKDLSHDPFLPAVMTWIQLEIFPSFAAGNAGPSPETVGSPGGLPPAFAVGATDSDDNVADFSSRGPVKGTADGKAVSYVKPDVSAPGHKVYSSIPGGKYASFSGTSMATPHVSGAIALLYQAFPNLTVAQMKELVMKSSDDLGNSGKDNDFGAGRLHIPRAMAFAAEISR